MSHSNSDADEYHFIGNIVRKQTKYGSTVNHSFKEPRYIEHKLQPSDTLQGLALKYNVSVSIFTNFVHLRKKMVYLSGIC